MAVLEAREAYTTDRAAALAGVPVRTVYYWASHGIWSPSVSQEKVLFWSLADVLTLRAIYWLRSREKWHDDREIPRTTMREVRDAVSVLIGELIDLTERALYVDQKGHVVLRGRDELLAHPHGQTMAEALVIDVLRPFEVAAGIRGPDLVVPRPTLRIIQGKLSGEPHVKGTRVRTLDIDRLLERGYKTQDVMELYPFLTVVAIEDSRELESQLRRNLTRRAA